jgi:hypothetical protein
MKKERILSYGLSEKLSEDDIKDVSGAASIHTTQNWTVNGTGGPGHWDGTADVTIDI